jgi:hypothetical protein
MRLLVRSEFLQAVWGTRMFWGRRAIQGSMGVAEEHGACACDGTYGRWKHWGCCHRSAAPGEMARGVQVTLLVSMIVRGYMMLTYAVDCISNYRALLTGALPVQAHAK